MMNSSLMALYKNKHFLYKTVITDGYDIQVTIYELYYIILSFPVFF